jgi:hypothetical protein
VSLALPRKYTPVTGVTALSFHQPTIARARRGALLV